MKAIFPTVLAITMLAGSAAAIANPQRLDDRLRRGDDVIRSLNNGRPQANLERLRQEFPFLAEATEGYALGRCGRGRDWITGPARRPPLRSWRPLASGI